jgi:hypothetical protein
VRDREARVATERESAGGPQTAQSQLGLGPGHQRIEPTVAVLVDEHHLEVGEGLARQAGDQLLERLDESELADLEDDTRSLRFDLCDACRQRFVKNPLGVKGGKQLDFSNN